MRRAEFEVKDKSALGNLLTNCKYCTKADETEQIHYEIKARATQTC